jgi:adenosine deaminase
VTLYADLHRHLGGSVVPRILWRYFQRQNPDLATRFPEYPEFEEFYTRPRNTLDEYLELHTLVESVQTGGHFTLFYLSTNSWGVYF